MIREILMSIGNEEVKLSLIAGNKLLYVENPKDHQKPIRNNKQIQ